MQEQFQPQLARLEPGSREFVVILADGLLPAASLLNPITGSFQPRNKPPLTDAAGDRAHRKAGRGRPGCHRSFPRRQACSRAYLLGPSLGAGAARVMNTA